MSRFIRQLISLSYITAVLLVGCTTSTDQNVTPSTASYLFTLNGVDQQVETQEDTLHVSSVQMIVGNLTLGIDGGSPFVVMNGQAEVSYSNSNADQSVRVLSNEIAGHLYRSYSFTVAPAENLQVSHPEYSVFITGMYNGENFELGSDTTFTRDINFSQPLYVPSQEAVVDINIIADIREWFIDTDGTILDPLSANGIKEIEKNIKPSFDSEVSISHDN